MVKWMALRHRVGLVVAVQLGLVSMVSIPGEAGQPEPEICGNDVDEDCNDDAPACIDSDNDGLDDALETYWG